jgi:hypothetical protein
MKVESILCDGCGKELIVDNLYPHCFNFELSIIDTQRNTGDTKYCVAQFPPFEGNKHFCSKECIIKWINKD